MKTEACLPDGGERNVKTEAYLPNEGERNVKTEAYLPDEATRAAARGRWDRIAKPLHSLGTLEDLIVQIAGIQGTADISLTPRCVLVFCADHGVTAEGVAQSGNEVTALVARSVAEGTSNISLMARRAGADVFAVDMGMAENVPGVIPRKIAPGTANMALGPAMSRGRAERAVRAGIDLVGEMRGRGYRVIAAGEMGIGNTTASAAMICAFLGLPPEEIVGRGAGLSAEGLRRKREAVRRALDVNRPDPGDPADVLAKTGGFEIAGMAGAFLGGMIYGVPVIIDGVVSAAAALTAVRMCPKAAAFLLPSHMSREPAARFVFEALGMKPVLDAGLALGEGTGAVLLFPLLDAAAAVYGGAHTFSSLGMSPYQKWEGLP